MITHGHVHGMYGHFSLLCGPWIPMPQLVSLAMFLQNLEINEKHGLGDLFSDGMPCNDVTLFKALKSRKTLENHYKMRQECGLVAPTTATLSKNITTL